MMRHIKTIVIAILPLFLVGLIISCSNNKEEKQTEEKTADEKIAEWRRHNAKGICFDFFGHEIESSVYAADEMYQIDTICENDPKLSVKIHDRNNCTIKVSKWKFKLWLIDGNIVLKSDQSLGSKKMKAFTKYLNKVYGAPTSNNSKVLLWSNVRGEKNYYIRLSESPINEGGTDVEFLPFPDRCFINSVCGHIERDTLTGAYMENRKVSLWFECCDTVNREIWQLVCSDKKVKPVKFYAYRPLLVDEGDLDGDGIRDFGFINTWLTSNCRDYNVLTIKDGKFQYMFEFETALSLRTSGKDLVSATGKKGRVRVTYSNMDAPLSCCSWAPDTTVIRTVQLKDVDQSEFK